MKPAVQSLDPPSLTSWAALEAGAVVAGRFEIRERLGCGPVGAVYSAFDRNRSNEIALKVFNPAHIHQAEARELFLHAAKQACDLAHPHIVNIYDLHREGDCFFLSMERLSGHSLRHELDARRSKGANFTHKEVRRWARQLGSAFAYAHQFTTHGNIKPENIWITEGGSAKVMDFGMARFIPSEQVTASSLLHSTTFYLAPDRLSPHGEDTPEADQFSLAAVFYELLTGKPVVGIPQEPRGLRPDLSSRASKAITRALNSTPAGRWPHISSFTDELAKGLARPSLSISPERRRLAAALAALLVAIGLAFNALLKTRSTTTSTSAIVSRDLAESAQYDIAALVTRLEAEFAQIQQREQELERALAQRAVAPTDQAVNSSGQSVSVELELLAHVRLRNALLSHLPSFSSRNFDAPASADLSELEAIKQRLATHLQLVDDAREGATAWKNARAREREHRRLLLAGGWPDTELTPIDELMSEADAAWHSGEFASATLGYREAGESADKLSRAKIDEAHANATEAWQSWLDLFPPGEAPELPARANFGAWFGQADELSNAKAWSEAVGPLLKIAQVSQAWTTAVHALPSPSVDGLFQNSLGMKFVPLTTNVLISIWETRVMDYARFAQATGYDNECRWRDDVPFEDGPTHPVVFVTQMDAWSFCRWLTQRERASGLIKENQRYRLPLTEEWQLAVASPGAAATPPSGNYFSVDLHRTITAPHAPTDPHPYAAPVGSFLPNNRGIYDLGGNVWEWGEERRDFSMAPVRGGSWSTTYAAWMQPTAETDERAYKADVGFRLVLVSEQTIEPPESSF